MKQDKTIVVTLPANAIIPINIIMSVVVILHMLSVSAKVPPVNLKLTVAELQPRPQQPSVIGLMFTIC